MLTNFGCGERGRFGPKRTVLGLQEFNAQRPGFTCQLDFNSLPSGISLSKV